MKTNNQPTNHPASIVPKISLQKYKVYDREIINLNRQPIPRANNTTILSYEYVEKTKAILAEFGQIALINFAAFWDIKYNEVVDFVALKYDGGLVGFLSNNSHLFDLVWSKSGFLVVSLISRPASRFSSDSNDTAENLPDLWRALVKQRSIDRTIGKLFNEMNYLWMERPWKRYLQKRNIAITMSPYESALDCYYEMATNMIHQIRRTLQNNPSGLRVDQFYKHIKIHQALRMFGVSISASSLVDELPEIFYRKKSDDPEEDLIFDAALHSIADLTGEDDTLFHGGLTPEFIATYAINKGLYQKTLILIREAGQVLGLKINVWMQSLKLNFYCKNEAAFEEDIKPLNTLTFFLALARYKLVELRPQRAIKNDIKAFLPRRYVKFVELKLLLPKLMDHRGNVADVGDDSEDGDGETEDEEKENHQAAEVVTGCELQSHILKDTNNILRDGQN